MKTYQEYMQERMAEFAEQKAEDLWFLRDSIKVLSHYAELAKQDGDEEGSQVFDKYLVLAKENLRRMQATYDIQEERLASFFAERGINISEWE